MTISSKLASVRVTTSDPSAYRAVAGTSAASVTAATSAIIAVAVVRAMM